MKAIRNLLLSLSLFVSTVLGAVEQWDIYELSLEGPEEGNPFVEIELYARFTDGKSSYTVRGFYDGGGLYKIRFMPPTVGTWRYTTQSNCWELTNEQGTFKVVPPSKGNHGPVSVYRDYHFTYADGTPYWPIGTTIYSWLNRPAEIQEMTLETLREAPFNKVRMLIFPERLGSRSAPEIFPYVGTPPDDWDYTRFNPAFFQMVEKRIGELAELGIEADIILFHKYGSEWAFDTMTPEQDAHYLRYVAARLGAYRNVWWSMANEYDFVRTKTEDDWDRLFEILVEEDPYNHLRSIHNGFLIYDHNKEWITHASVQNGAAVEDPGRAQMYRDVWRKPVVYDEVKYEGNIERRWGQLTAREMVHRFWNGTVAGTYVGHGECYLVEEDDLVWLSTGGVLRGESPLRIAFLRKILEDGPHGLDPIDKWQETNVAGVAGEYYLKYFGKDTPREWPFKLYRDGVADGQRYRVEIIDTWNMTITPVETLYEMQRKDSYHFVDKDGRVVELPDRPGIALRIRRVSGATGIYYTEEPQ
jgi:hypothetical protein